MPNKILWEQQWVSRGTVLGTELNSLAAGSRSAAGTAVDNSVNLDQFGVLQLVVTFSAQPTVGGRVDLYMITAPDGTNYEDGSATVDPGQHKLIASLIIRADPNPQRLLTRPFPLEPAKTKFLLANQTDKAFVASGSTLSLYTGNDEIQ